MLAELFDKLGVFSRLVSSAVLWLYVWRVRTLRIVLGFYGKYLVTPYRRGADRALNEAV